MMRYLTMKNKYRSLTMNNHGYKKIISHSIDKNGLRTPRPLVSYSLKNGRASSYSGEGMGHPIKCLS